MKTIAILLPDSGGGGIYQYVQQLALALSPSVRVHVVVADPFQSTLRPLEGQVEVHTVNEAWVREARQDLDRGGLRHLPDLCQALATAIAGWRKVEELSPDCAEVSDWPLSFVPAVLSRSVPYVVQCHGSMGQIDEHDNYPSGLLQGGVAQMLELQLLSYAHQIQTYSHQNAAFWESALNQRVQVLRPPLKVPPFEASELQTKSGIVLGRLQRWKGPHILAGALERMGEGAPTIDWYGGVKPWNFEEGSADRFLARRYPKVWESTLLHHAPVSRDKAQVLQRGSHFSVVPSTWDVFNFTAVEAMVAGCPTIVSSGAGASELISNGVNGFTFLNANPDSLAGALDQAMSLSASQRQAMGHAGYATVERELCPSLAATQRITQYALAKERFDRETPKRPPQWVYDLIKPPGQALSRPDEMLNKIPLRTIMAHVRQRATARLGLTG